MNGEYMVKKLLVVLGIVVTILTTEICYISSNAVSANMIDDIAELEYNETNGSTEIEVTETADRTVTTESQMAVESISENEIYFEDEFILTTAVTTMSDEPSEEIIQKTEEVAIVELTESEKDMLLRIGMAEVGGEHCTDCIALVMRVVLNRVEADGFPSSIYWVIYAEGQFSPVANGAFDNAYPNEQCYEALEMVMNGWDESQGALFFESNSGPCWHSRNCEFLFQHCNTEFYK